MSILFKLQCRPRAGAKRKRQVTCPHQKIAGTRRHVASANPISQKFQVTRARHRDVPEVFCLDEVDKPAAGNLDRHQALISRHHNGVQRKAEAEQSKRCPNEPRVFYVDVLPDSHWAAFYLLESRSGKDSTGELASLDGGASVTTR